MIPAELCMNEVLVKFAEDEIKAIAAPLPLALFNLKALFDVERVLCSKKMPPPVRVAVHEVMVELMMVSDVPGLARMHPPFAADPLDSSDSTMETLERMRCMAAPVAPRFPRKVQPTMAAVEFRRLMQPPVDSVPPSASFSMKFESEIVNLELTMWKIPP